MLGVGYFCVNFAFGSIKLSIKMEATAFNQTQIRLLKLFSHDNSQEFADEIEAVLMRHFQEKLDAESDALWDSGVLDEQRLNELKDLDIHAWLRQKRKEDQA